MGVLNIRLIRGDNLVSKDFDGYSDPYVELQIGGHTLKSKTIQKTLNPVWNQLFSFKNVMNPNVDKLIVRVYDYDFWKRDDYLGYCVVPLDKLVRGKPSMQSHKLMQVAHGTITLELTAVDFGLSPQQQLPQSYVPQPQQLTTGLYPNPMGNGVPRPEFSGAQQPPFPANPVQRQYSQHEISVPYQSESIQIPPYNPNAVNPNASFHHNNTPYQQPPYPMTGYGYPPNQFQPVVSQAPYPTNLNPTSYQLPQFPPIS